MTTYESDIKTINQKQDDVYAVLSDLNSLNKIKEANLLSDESVAEYIKDISFDSDSIQVSVLGLGDMALRIIEREPSKTIKFETENSPMQANAWIQLLPVGDNQTKMKITLKADLPMMLKMMLNDKLKKAVNKAADAIVLTLEKQVL